MGIYDRDYYREERRSFALSGPRTVVGVLILANVVLYLANWLLTPPSVQYPLGAITDALSARVGTLVQPWLWWQYLTYGFVHDTLPSHIILNMLGLFFLGRDVESLYGPREFLRLYLVTLVFGGVVWAVIGRLTGDDPRSMVLGASGAIAGIVVLYAMNFPHRTLMLFFVLPVPAWLAGVILVGMDAYGGVMRPEGSRVAYTVHLAGAAFAFLYVRYRWNFNRLGFHLSLPGWLKRRPRLRVHDPESEDHREASLSAEVDRILEKISREGESSLTRKERRTLESASREYQKRRQGH